MKLLKKHALTEFLKILFVAASAMISLFLVIEVVEKIDDIIVHNVPMAEGVLFFLFKIPSIFVQISPVAVVLSTLLSLGILNKYGEITAIRAGGISLLSVLSPLFISGVVISAAVIFINETIVPISGGFVSGIEKKYLVKQDKTFFGSEGYWFKTDKFVYNVRKIDADKNTLEGINIYEFDDTFAMKERIAANSARWDGFGWTGKGVDILVFGKDGVTEKTIDDNFVINGIKSPKELLLAEKDYKKMGFMELLNYIKRLEEDGYDTNKYRLELYSKISFPIINFIMVLISIPFALRTTRGAGLGAGVGISVIIMVIYWILSGVMKTLGGNAILPPIIASFFPDILFAAIGVYMYGYVRE